MGHFHRWEEFPAKTVYFLENNPASAGIKSRRIATDRMMVSNISVKGGGIIPRHCHEAEQIMLIQKGKARVTIGDKRVHPLGPGDIWVVPPNRIHGVEYLGDVEALEIVSPPRLDTLPGYLIPHTFLEKEISSGRKKKVKKPSK